MEIWTPYELMEASAKLCPENQNIKMLLRHSIRHDDIAKDDKAQLTNEGKIIAKRLGKSLALEIGTVSSSPRKRCIDTCYEIINGHSKKYDGEIIETKTLQKPHCMNDLEAKETWKNFESLEDPLEGAFDCFAKNIDMPGFYNLEFSSKQMIDYIFETGNKDNTIDIFCTHDFQLAMLLLYFDENKYEYKEKLFPRNNTWPLMLEGMFLWKNSNGFSTAWRGEIIY